jgi:GGDEF domain-containing protein
LLQLHRDDSIVERHGLGACHADVPAVAGFLAASLRDTDVVAHYAPDCFALLLPATPLVEARLMAQQLREGLDTSSTLSHKRRQPLLSNVGVVETTGSDDSFSLLKRAEAALNGVDGQDGDSTEDRGWPSFEPLAQLPS